jgi:hypothetical protein
VERDGEKFKIIEIDGYSYLVQHPQVEEAWEIGITLTKMIGGSAAAMAGGAQDADSAAAALQVAIDGLLNKIDPAQTMGMMKKLFRYVEVQGKSGSEQKSKLVLDEKGIKEHFRGSLGSMLKLFGEVVAFTHRDFFSALGDGVKDLMSLVEEKK